MRNYGSSVFFKTYDSVTCRRVEVLGVWYILPNPLRPSETIPKRPYARQLRPQPGLEELKQEIQAAELTVSTRPYRRRTSVNETRSLPFNIIMFYQRVEEFPHTLERRLHLPVRVKEGRLSSPQMKSAGSQSLHYLQQLARKSLAVLTRLFNGVLLIGLFLES